MFRSLDGIGKARKPSIPDVATNPRTRAKIMKTTEGKEAQPALGVPPGSEQVFRTMAARYVWWKTSEEALRYPQQTAAQVMNLGDWDDVQILARSVGDDFLRSVIRSAEAGQFNERSWAYWHYRLHLAKLGRVPPLPERKIG